MRRIGLWAVAAVVVVGGGYWGFGAYSNYRLRAALDQALQHLPPGYTLRYKTATYAPGSGKTDLGGVEVHIPLSADAFDGTIDHVQLTGLNLALADRWSEAQANPAAWKPDQALPVADEILLEGLHFHSALQTVDLATERLNGMRLYPASLLHPGLPALADVVGGMGGGKPPSPELLLKVIRFEAAMILGTGLDRLETGDIKVTGHMPPDSPMPNQPYSYEFAQSTSTGMDRGVWQETAGSGISFGMQPVFAAKVGRVGFSGIDVRQAATRLIDAQALVPSLFDGLSIKRVEYADVAVQPQTGAPISLEGFSLLDLAFARGEPVSGGVLLKGLHIDQSQMTQPGLAMIHAQLGLDHMTIGISAAFDRDLATGRGRIHDTYVKVDELGSVDLAADVSGLPAGGDPLAATLAHAVLRYRDGSLVDRLLRLMAKGGDPEQARSQVILAARQQGALFGTGPVIASAIEALVSFVKQPGLLTIEATPPRPVPVTTLAAAESLPPKQLVGLLGLAVRAEK